MAHAATPSRGRRRLGVLLALHAGVTLGASVTPIQKVVKLLEDMKAEVETEGKAEAGTYDKFACFCKDTTTSKSEAITGGLDKIDTLTADIEENTATRGEKATELTERKQKQEELAKQLDEETARCEKEAAEFEEEIADLSKAVSSLDNAVTALEKGKPSLLQEAAIQDVRESVALAEALGLAGAAGAPRGGGGGSKASALQAFLQQGVDPEDPDYKFHSQGVLDTLKEMQTDFTKKKGEVETEFKDAKKACDDLKKTLGDQMKENGGQIDTLKTDIDGLEKTIAQDRESLVQAEDTLKDDQLYLRDLTERCEKAAKDWDQRSAGRADELKALSEALVVLKEGKDGKKSVQELDKVNMRAFVQRRPAANGTAATAAKAATAGASRVSAKTTARAVAPTAAARRATPPALLQRASVQRHGAAALRGAAEATAVGGRRGRRAAEVLRGEGVRLRSEMLTEMAEKVAADPFAKVKQLISELIERLLEEARQEATKKGFCDTEVGKAKNDRDSRLKDATRAMAELKMLDAKKDDLNETITELEEDIPKLWETLNETTTQRKEEKKQNIETIKLAKEGSKAVKEAIEILKSYYGPAAKAKSLLQASPVDEDTEGPGFSGGYQGKQSGAGGIIGMLEVIAGDFARTAKMTQQEEDEAQADFVEFDRVSRTDISAKETSLELSTEDLKDIKTARAETLADLETAQGLVDKALQALEDLKPMCIDTSMSFEDRTKKREDEIAALKQALCILDPDGVEDECA